MSDSITIRSGEFDAGKAACKASHGALADRWQEIGRQGCEATHDDIAATAYEEALFACRQTHRQLVRSYRVRAQRKIVRAARRGLTQGQRQGAVLGLGVAFALAVVAGYLGRRR